MIILLFTLFGLGIGIVCIFLDLDEIIPILLCVTFGVLFYMELIAFPINIYGVNSKIAEFHSIQQTLNEARKKGNDIENAALQMKIIDANKWLASKKYYKNSIFGLWIPDNIEKLEPIK